MAAIKAVATQESPRGAFDSQGRPAILYERHYFSRLTKHLYDKTHKDISSPIPYGRKGRPKYGSYDSQFTKLDGAYKLDQDAAPMSTSWGAIQIMGENYKQAGYASAQDFVAAMKNSVQDHLNAFVNFIDANPKMKTAIQKKDWATFAGSTTDRATRRTTTIRRSAMHINNSASSALVERFSIAGRSRVLALILCVFASVGAQPVATAPFHARLLSAGELAATRARLNAPPSARVAGELKVDPKQVFALERGGKVWMVVEPVRYDSHDTEVPARTSFRCGVFFLPAEGAANFVTTIGYGDYEPVECTALKAVRFKYAKGRTAPPRIAISYAGNTPHTASEQDVVLSWSVAKKAYVEDER